MQPARNEPRLRAALRSTSPPAQSRKVTGGLVWRTSDRRSPIEKTKARGTASVWGRIDQFHSWARTGSGPIPGSRRMLARSAFRMSSKNSPRRRHWRFRIALPRTAGTVRGTTNCCRMTHCSGLTRRYVLAGTFFRTNSPLISPLRFSCGARQRVCAESIRLTSILRNSARAARAGRGLLDGGYELGVLKGLREEAVLAQVRRPPGNVGEVAAYEDDVQAGESGAHAAHQLEPVHVGHQDVADDEGGRGCRLLDGVQRRLGAVRRLHGPSLLLEDELDQVAHGRLVVDDEHPALGRRGSGSC